MTKKNQMWHSHQDKCKYYMSEIAEFFAGNRNWQGEHKDDDLAEYFVKIANTVEAFEYKDTTRTGRKIQKLLQALEDLQLQHTVIADNV